MAKLGAETRLLDYLFFMTPADRSIAVLTEYNHINQIKNKKLSLITLQSLIYCFDRNRIENIKKRLFFTKKEKKVSESIDRRDFSVIV